MKAYYFLSILSFFIYTAVYSQDDSPDLSYSYRGKTYDLSSSSIVKDSAGEICSVTTWVSWLMSGEYLLHPKELNNPKTEFLVRKLSVEELNRLKPVNTHPADEKIEFSGKDLNGHKINSKKLIGKIVVLNFWFINCPPCRHEMPYLNKLVMEHQSDSNVVFIAIGLDTNWEINEFLKTTPFKYTIIPSGGYKDFKIDAYPTQMILDKEGKVAFRTIGYSPIIGYWIRRTIETLQR